MIPDYFDLENRRIALLQHTLHTSSPVLCVLEYYKYFRTILELKHPGAEEAFLKEFAGDYVDSLSKFEVWGADPLFSQKLIDHLNELKTRPFVSEYEDSLNNSVQRLSAQLKDLSSILDGKEIPEAGIHKIYFPLIEKNESDEFFGILDSISIKIHQSAAEDNFTIIPSDKKQDLRIIAQCRQSWQAAVRILKQYVKKPLKYHEVLISFEKKEGFYEGNSLGTALAIAFLDQLMKLYSPVYYLFINTELAITGAVEETGRVLITGNKIIRKKTDVVFYSGIKAFVFPKAEEKSVLEEIQHLKKKYPERKLKLVPIEEIDDILNRRDLVEIRKRNIAVRGGKFIRKNWISAAAVIVLAVILALLFAIDLDDNPYNYSIEQGGIKIKNRNGKILWIDKTNAPVKEPGENLNSTIFFADINRDGQNEVILSNDDVSMKHHIRCCNNKGDIIWKYSLTDTVYSDRERLLPPYNILILDTLMINGVNNIFAAATNVESFSSAVFRLNIENGERLPGTVWSSGHVESGIIKDINNDGKKDILCLGFDNGYEDAVLFGYSIDDSTRVRPTTNEYRIKNFRELDPIVYIRFAKTDFDIYMGYRTPVILNGIKDEKSLKIYRFITSYDLLNHKSAVWYEVNYNLKDINVVIGGGLRIARDSLVFYKKLSPPYTDTPDYKNLIKSRILYWEQDKWIKKGELDSNYSARF